MTKTELRIKVAELQGWTEIEPDMWIKDVYQGVDPRYGDKQVIPNYPESMDACMALVEEMKEHKILKYIRPHYRKDEILWEVNISVPNLLSFETRQKTLQRAICEAYLAWKEK